MEQGHNQTFPIEQGHNQTFPMEQGHNQTFPIEQGHNQTFPIEKGQNQTFIPLQMWANYADFDPYSTGYVGTLSSYQASSPPIRHSQFHSTRTESDNRLRADNLQQSTMLI